MSPRRRRVLAGVVGLAAAIIVAFVVRGLVGGSPGAADQSRPGPVILVPGYGGDVASLSDLAARLRQAGRSVSVLSLPDGGTGDLHRQADALEAAVSQQLAAGAPSVDLIGYSAGGVTVRLWASEDGHASHARRIVTIGSPHHGTSVAQAAGLLFGAACAGACSQLEPGSSLLDGLNAGDETPNGPRWISIWTTMDQTVVPPDSARLQGADNIAIQSVCPADRVGHSGEPRDPAVVGLVVASLGIGALPHPTSSDCARYRALGTPRSLARS